MLPWLVLAAVAAAPTGTAAAVPIQTPGVAPTQAVAALFTAHEAFANPDPRGASIELVPDLRPLTRERTVLPVLGERRGAGGAPWLHVRLPGRPNGHSGWIAKRGTRVSTTMWHLVVNTSRRTLTVYRSGLALRIVKAVVGKPSTPTPHGQFFVEESIALRAGDVGAPYALALSARSNVLQEFDGGPGQIGVHGLMNVGGVPGTAISHGCVRLDNAVMRWLAVRIRPGVPVTIS